MKAVDNILNELTTAVDEARRSYYRLVLLIGPSDSGKTQLLRQLAEVLEPKRLREEILLELRESLRKYESSPKLRKRKLK